MKLIRIVLKDYEGWYQNGKLIFEGPLPHATCLAQALGYEVTEQFETKYRVTSFNNSMPESIDTVQEHIKIHNKLK